uniref:Uncharacterized protein n=1 Tax=Zea mays TaxID=4577 RepID=C0HJ21_MAIZE|nr:unknown [Zea mays]
MLPFPPSVLILVLLITGLPENAEVPRISGAFLGGRIRRFISCKVTSPSCQDGLMRVKGYATEVVKLSFVTSDELAPLETLSVESFLVSCIMKLSVIGAISLVPEIPA